MKIERGTWHYNAAHFASRRLEREIFTRGGYYGRVTRGLVTLFSLLTLVASLFLGPLLVWSFNSSYLTLSEIPTTLLVLGILGLLFDALIIGGFSMFIVVIILSMLDVHLLTPFTTWLNKRQGSGILASYITSLSDEVTYGDTNNSVDVD